MRNDGKEIERKFHTPYVRIGAVHADFERQVLGELQLASSETEPKLTGFRVAEGNDTYFQNRKNGPYMRMRTDCSANGQTRWVELCTKVKTGKNHTVRQEAEARFAPGTDESEVTRLLTLQGFRRILSLHKSSRIWDLSGEVPYGSTRLQLAMYQVTARFCPDQVYMELEIGAGYSVEEGVKVLQRFESAMAHKMGVYPCDESIQERYLRLLGKKAYNDIWKKES